MRYLFLVQYDGTHFSGYQRQKNGRTVQGELERAAREVFGTETKVVASGRTDAGVHAEGQVCQVDAETGVPAKKLRECFNCLLPPDVRILKSAPAPEGFDVTRGAKQKTYVYTAYFSETELPLWERYAVRLKERPDFDRMKMAADLMKGEHDFAAFRAAGYTSKTSVRTVYAVEISQKMRVGSNFIQITVTGNGFLYNMVRIMAGEIFAVGFGKGTENLSRALMTGERSLLAKTMPAKGLTMKNVDYGIPLFGNVGEE